MGRQQGLSRTKSALNLGAPMSDVLLRTKSSPDIRSQLLWTERHMPDWPYYVTEYKARQGRKYVWSNVYSPNYVKYHRHKTYLNAYNWYDRYSAYPVSYNRDWLNRRYVYRNYKPIRHWYAFPFLGYSSSMYSPKTNYLLTGLAY
ncbi:hypothetical protein Ddc_20179 [Ditylenchus destructor]|nr:hypothetical protein Ddc_20179 [Ditylenchus destructor]